MIVSTARYFEKKFARLSIKIQKQFAERLQLFMQNPRHPLLRDHALHGCLYAKRVFSITGDYRVIYRFIDEQTIKLLDFGTHNQVY